MRVRIERVDALPPCSWAVDVNDGAAVALLGRRVEDLPGMIAEGAWAGDLAPHGALTSPFRSGSGAIFSDRAITLFGPSHCLDPIYCFAFKGTRRILASNSFHMCLAVSPEAGFGKEQTEQVRARAHTLMNGTVRYERVLYETSAGVMYRLAWTTFVIDPSVAEVSESSSIGPALPPFATYADYRAYLSKIIADTVANARDSRRRGPFTSLLTSCSAGYDSPACAVLAREHGCAAAVTISSSRGGLNDTGAHVAGALGLKCHEYPRFGKGVERRAQRGEQLVMSLGAALSLDHEIAASELLASLATTEDLVYRPFEPHLPGTVFFTGFHGDKVWNMKCASGPEILRGDNSGSGLDEFRKKLGFVHVAVPFIGARYHAALRKISRSLEMADFRIGGSYDRPIPRRIVEEAGVPRNLFGLQKRACSVLLRMSDEDKYKLISGQVERYASALASSRPN